MTELTDDDFAVLAALLREMIAADRFALSPPIPVRPARNVHAHYQSLPDTLAMAAGVTPQPTVIDRHGLGA